MKKNVKRLIAGAVVLLVAAGIVVRIAGGNKKEEEYETRPTVAVENPKTGDITLYTDLTGTIEPISKAVVQPKIGGELLEVNFQAGDPVEAGQVLCKIDSDALTALQLQMQSASVAADNAARELARIQPLYASGYISQQQFDQAQSSATSARLAYESAKNQYDLQVEYTTVTAPISGVIESRNVEPHDHVGTDTKICVISGGDQLQVKFGITEKILRNMKVNDPIQVEKNGTEYDGNVTEVGSMVNSATGLYDAKAFVNNAESLTSCAGGVRSKATLEVNTQDINNKKLIKINISGLKGGHSGMDIIKERGNSNKILGRVLKGLLREVKYNLVTLSGGSKNNAIPREAEAIISVNENDENTVIEVINNWNDIIQNELRAQDPGVKIEGILINSDENKEFTDECTQKVVDLLYIYPNGINTKSTEIEGLVESSTNLGIVSEKNNVVEFDSAIRSSIPSLKEEIVLRSKTIVELLGGKFETTSDYPGWEYNPDSKIREICQKVHKEMYGEEAKIVAIHAGVECGLFNERLGNLDMISFGPNLYDVHTPDEHMSISSVKNCYEYLLEILKSIK